MQTLRLIPVFEVPTYNRTVVRMKNENGTSVQFVGIRIPVSFARVECYLKFQHPKHDNISSRYEKRAGFGNIFLINQEFYDFSA